MKCFFLDAGATFELKTKSFHQCDAQQRAKSIHCEFDEFLTRC